MEKMMMTELKDPVAEAVKKTFWTLMDVEGYVDDHKLEGALEGLRDQLLDCFPEARDEMMEELEPRIRQLEEALDAGVRINRTRDEATKAFRAFGELIKITRDDENLSSEVEELQYLFVQALIQAYGDEWYNAWLAATFRGGTQ
jgi:hypothetical protein